MSVNNRFEGYEHSGIEYRKRLTVVAGFKDKSKLSRSEEKRTHPNEGAPPSRYSQILELPTVDTHSRRNDAFVN
jgi:hypothetical protein